jgi:hypothetical protein
LNPFCARASFKIYLSLSLSFEDLSMDGFFHLFFSPFSANKHKDHFLILFVCVETRMAINVGFNFQTEIKHWPSLPRTHQYLFAHWALTFICSSKRFLLTDELHTPLFGERIDNQAIQTFPQKSFHYESVRVKQMESC